MPPGGDACHPTLYPFAYQGCFQGVDRPKDGPWPVRSSCMRSRLGCIREQAHYVSNACHALAVLLASPTRWWQARAAVGVAQAGRTNQGRASIERRSSVVSKRSEKAL